MNYLDRDLVDLGAECQEDAQTSMEVLARRAEQLSRQLASAPADDPGLRARLLTELSRTEVSMDRTTDAWGHAMEAFRIQLAREDWEQAVVACDALFSCGTDEALIALGHGLWLGITFPIDPSLTVRQLMHVIDETPAESDGAAVAAAVAAYVVELRSEGNQHSELSLAVGQLLNDVARRHGNVRGPEAFKDWFSRLELDDPAKFLVRMRNVIDVLVQDQWWIDRDALQATLPPEH